MNLYKLRAYGVRKLEYTECVNKIIGIVENNNPEALKIDGFLNLLKTKVPELEKLTKDDGKHPLTVLIEEKRKECQKILGAILSHKTGHKKMPIPGKENAYKNAFPVLDQLLVQISRWNNKVRERITKLLISEYNQNDVFKTAMDEIGFEVLIDKLRNVQSEIAQFEDKRIIAFSEKRKLVASELMYRTTALINKFLTSIEIAAIENSDLDYTNLILQLNELISKYRALSASRKTRMIVANDENKEVDKKKTVASSTTTIATAS